MTSLFYRNFRLLILTIVLILVWGISSFLALPRLEDPELTSRNALVKTFLPGSNAERVEALVTEKIETELAKIEEIKTYESVSRTGSSIINIELLERIQADEADDIWSNVEDKLDDAVVNLPPGATYPKLETFDIKAYASIISLIWQQDDSPNYSILKRSGQLLQDELEALPGTEKVDIFGAPNEEITVEIDETKLTALNLTARELSKQISQSDAKITAGQFRSSTSDLLLLVDSELSSLDRISNIPIKVGGKSQLVRLGDIAGVHKGITIPATDLAFISGRPAIALAVFVDSDYRLDRWNKDLQQSLDRFRQQLPTGLELQESFSQNHYVQSRLNRLLLNLFIGAVLVFTVTLFTMGWKSASIVGTTLPLSAAMVLGLMRVLDLPLHQMSITGLIVALGLLIDSSIVMVDETVQRLQAGMKSEVAIANSIRHLIAPLLSSTLTTILAFMPIILLPGAAGEFVGPLGICVAISLCGSLFLSVSVVPALAARLHCNSSIYCLETSKFDNNRAKIHHQKISIFPWWHNGFSHPRLTQLYRLSLRWIFARPVLGVLLALLLPVMGFIQTLSLVEQFFPPADRDQIQIEVELPASASLAQTRDITQQARTLILKHSKVNDVHWFLGRSAPRYYYNLAGGREQYANYAQGFIQLSSIAEHDLINTIQAEMNEAFPASRTIVRQLDQGPPFDAPVELRIYGSDLEQLKLLGEQVRVNLALIPQITHTRDSLSEILPQLKLQIDEDETRVAGLNNASVSQQLEATLEGNLGGTILEETEELPVRVRIANRERGDLRRINSLDLISNSDSPSIIPLSSLGEVKVKPEISVISRRNGRRFNLVQGYIAAGVLPAQVLTQFQQKSKESEFDLPSGYSIEIGGESEERDNTLAQMFRGIDILVVLMIATLVLSLNSFRSAVLIGIVAICSIGLGFLSLATFSYPLGFMGIVGTFGLVGISVNDSVVVLAAIQEDPAARLGNCRAIIEVIIRSTRHVIATTLTTMIGFVPLVIERGGFWPPLAVAISGGVCGATLLSLYFVPSAYLLFVGNSNQKFNFLKFLTRKSNVKGNFYQPIRGSYRSRR